jgi:hypothetical protein
MELGSYFLFLQEQTKDIIIITEQNSSIGWGGVNSRAAIGVNSRTVCIAIGVNSRAVCIAIGVNSRAVCIAIGHLCGVNFCKRKTNNWSKVLITSGYDDAWVVPTSSRMFFSQVRAKIQGRRCIPEGSNPGFIIGDSGDFDKSPNR